MKKAVSTAMALSMMVGLMGVNVNVNASAYEAGSYDGVSITMLNTKSELQDYLVDAAAEWGELTGASLDVYTISDSGSPRSSALWLVHLPVPLLAASSRITSTR